MLCVYLMWIKVIVNIDAFISHVMGNERKEGREDVAFVGRGRWF